MNILNQIAEKTRLRVDERKKIKSLDEIKSEAASMKTNGAFPFEKALRGQGMSFICEVKKASPSKGIIAPSFPYLEIAREYEAAGAAALSVLTEPDWFLGKDEYLEEICQAVKIPVLRKDFTVDAYQIYESKLLGASAILLICSLLDESTLKRYLDISHQLGLSVLVEAHTKEEVQMAVSAGARIIGINNRDLKTFEENIQNSLALRRFIPPEVLFVSESGIKNKDDMDLLSTHHTDAVLIGEAMMRSPNKKEFLKTLRGDAL
jgi:indole-3-glycerol phosphate synthase